MNADYWILLGVWVTASALLVGLAYWRGWHYRRQKVRAPVAEKLLRAPGESLRRKLEELDEQISEKLAVAYVLPLMVTSTVLLQPRHTLISPATIGGMLIGVPTFICLCRRLVSLLDQRRRYRLGLSGERAVGEELNLLILAGCRVFHDVPNEPYGNIDHVLVAPAGVYAVETKTRRKKEGKDAHKAGFDGQAIRFGDGPPEHACLDQARQQASRLSDWLSKATGEVVAVRPVLALPGWYVERKGKSEVIVISGKAVKMFAKWQPVLNEASVLRIACQLEQRCRDVEF